MMGAEWVWLYLLHVTYMEGRADGYIDGVAEGRAAEAYRESYGG